MPLIDYVPANGREDHFELAILGYREHLPFPCCVCVHRAIMETEDPCQHCAHNAKGTPREKGAKQ